MIAVTGTEKSSYWQFSRKIPLPLFAMPSVPITREQIMAVICDPKNHRRKLWTASVVLDRMGVYRKFEDQANYRKNDRLRVKKLLAELCEKGLLQVVKERHTLHSATWSAEVAYGLPQTENTESTTSAQE